MPQGVGVHMERVGGSSRVVRVGEPGWRVRDVVGPVPAVVLAQRWAGPDRAARSMLPHRMVDREGGPRPARATAPARRSARVVRASARSPAWTRERGSSATVSATAPAAARVEGSCLDARPRGRCSHGQDPAPAPSAATTAKTVPSTSASAGSSHPLLRQVAVQTSSWAAASSPRVADLERDHSHRAASGSRREGSSRPVVSSRRRRSVAPRRAMSACARRRSSCSASSEAARRSSSTVAGGGSGVHDQPDRSQPLVAGPDRDDEPWAGHGGARGHEEGLARPREAAEHPTCPEVVDEIGRHAPPDDGGQSRVVGDVLARSRPALATGCPRW